ncbi:Hypothetical protein DHA2_151984 [Giardia duodenalis]|uniref:Uncharacterized protein n=1 Tax=Giardia intestinalis TaxID=5741 RepID=V6TEX2_GIAIN|nr:Hypothetical protein DHA2_151984 [Giardia intestinalis]
MELLESLIALAEMRPHQIREYISTGRKRLMDAVHDGLTPYQRTAITIQIDELQRHRLRQFRLLDFLLGLSTADSSVSTALPIYAYNNLAKSSIEASTSREPSDLSSSNDSFSDVSLSVANQYVMFRCLRNGVTHYRSEYILHLLGKSVSLRRRYGRRFLLPYRFFYSQHEDTVHMFLSLRDYMVLLPLEVILENFAIARYHLFANVFCFFIKDLLDVMALFHEHEIVLSGDLSHLCVDRLSGRIKLNLCTYSVPIPRNYHAGVEEDLRAVANLILRYTHDSTLYPISDVQEQLLQIAHSIHQSVSQDHSDQFLVIPNLSDVAKCLAQHPVFFSNAYPSISIINTDIVAVFTTAQELSKEMQVASIDETADSIYPLADSTPRADVSLSRSPGSQHDFDNWFTTASYQPLPPIGTMLLGSNAAATPATRSRTQGPESLEIEMLGDSPVQFESTSSTIESSTTGLSPEPRLNLELQVGPPPPMLSTAMRISDRYTHSWRTVERLKRETAKTNVEENREGPHNIHCCAKTSEQCLPPGKLFPVAVPQFPVSAISIIQAPSPQPQPLHQRAASNPPPSNTITRLQIANPNTSPISWSHVPTNVPPGKGRKASFGGSVLTTKISRGEHRSKSQPTPAIAPISRTIYTLNIGTEAPARKPAQFLPLKQSIPIEARPEPQAKGIAGLTTVAPPAFPPASGQAFRRHSHSAAPPLSQTEVTESISKALGPKVPYQYTRNPVFVAHQPAPSRSLSAQPRASTMEDVEDYDVLYSRVTLHAPKFAEPVRRVLIERNFSIAASAPKATKDINPIEELNQALVNYW